MSNPTAFECKKDRLYQTQDGLWKLTVTVHPNDMPDWLLKAPMGQRLGATALHAVGDDEQPVTESPKEKTEGERAVQRAALLCKEREFQEWTSRVMHWDVCEENARKYICYACNVSSRSELATNAEALERFKRMETDYLQDTGRMARGR